MYSAFHVQISTISSLEKIFDCFIESEETFYTFWTFLWKVLNQENFLFLKKHSVVSVPFVHGLAALENPEGLERETGFLKNGV